MKVPPIYLVAGGAVALAGLYVWSKGAKETGKAVGGAVVDLADGVVSGTVESIGAMVNIPPTNKTQCEIDKAKGDTWAASFSCPAADFLRYVWN